MLQAQPLNDIQVRRKVTHFQEDILRLRGQKHQEVHLLSRHVQDKGRPLAGALHLPLAYLRASKLVYR